MKKISIALLVSLLIIAMTISVSAASFEAAKGTPTIDGDKDEAYSVAKEISIAVEVNGNSDYATGVAYTLWDNDALYVYIDITDKVVTKEKCAEDPTTHWHTDSAEIYLDLVNTGDDDVTTINAAQYTGGLVYGGNDWGGRGMHWDANKENSTYATKTTANGWALEAKIVWGSDFKPAVDSVIGFTIGINDDADGTDGRENQAFPSGTEQSNAWQMTGNYDDLKLTAAEFIPVVEEVVAAPAEEAPAAEAAPVTAAPTAPVAAAQTSDMSIIMAIGTLLTSGAALVISKKRK
jgi:Domain of unknown function (DUF1083).